MQFNKKRFTVVSLGIGICILFFRGILQNAPEGIALYIGPSLRIPQNCKHCAFLGCTPHPTHYLKKYGNVNLSDLKLSDFLDVNQLKDSFSQVLILCKNNKVDHLVIAYLPIYFADMRSLLQNNFIDSCRTFLTTIAPQVAMLLGELKSKLNPEITISLILPNEEALQKVPSQKVSDEIRTAYSIKQFPRLLSMNSLETISIINNRNSGQNEDIIKYLKYEHLLEKPLDNRTLETAKMKFHNYIPLV